MTTWRSRGAHLLILVLSGQLLLCGVLTASAAPQAKPTPHAAAPATRVPETPRPKPTPRPHDPPTQAPTADELTPTPLPTAPRPPAHQRAEAVNASLTESMDTATAEDTVLATEATTEIAADETSTAPTTTEETSPAADASSPTEIPSDISTAAATAGPTDVSPAPTDQAADTATPTVQETTKPSPTVPGSSTAAASPTGTPTRSETPGASPTPAATVTWSPTETPTATMTPSPSATPSPTPTATATPSPTATPPPALVAVDSIAPALVMNDQPAALTLRGASFAEGMVVAIGGEQLEDVQAESADELTATLPPGLCPGTYAATVTDALGRDVSGGNLEVQGVRAALIADSQVTASPVVLNGHDQHLTIPLPAIQITDTTCGTGGDLSIQVAVGEFTHAGGRPTVLAPTALSLDGAGLDHPLTARLVVSAGSAAAILVIPARAARDGATFMPSVQAVLPASAYAGQYVSTVSVALAEASGPITTTPEARGAASRRPFPAHHHPPPTHQGAPPTR